MHEPEKPDPVVVAVKPVNNAEKSAAELVRNTAIADSEYDASRTAPPIDRLTTRN